jgi:predicted metal-dependent phosphoesterase TrpH
LRIDLHIHSTASDGSLAPGALVSAARAGGLDVIAIADHDTCAGVEPARRTLQDQVHVVPAIELSTMFEGTELHVLGYFINHEHPRLASYSEDAAERRRERVRGMIARLEPYSIHVTLDDVLAAAEPGTRMVGRPHLARVLVQRGYVQTVSEAFERFIGDSGPAFLPTDLLSTENGIGLIHEAGGVAVWAHPRMHVLERHLATLAGWGLDGIECFRPGASASETEQLERRAKQAQMLMSGGSDWHGIWNGRLGDFFVNSSDIESLLEFGGM